MESPVPWVATLQEWIDVFMRRSMRNFFRRAKESSLSMSQIGALFHIHLAGDCGVSALGDELDISSAAASQMLERLVQQGLVVRTEAPHDRRVRQVTLTDKGHQVVQESIRARQDWLDSLARVLTPAEQEQIAAALTLLIAKANQLDLPPPA